MDLKGQLGGVEDDGGHPTGALIRAQQSHRLLTDAGRIAREIHGEDRFPALLALVAGEGVGIGALLHLTLLRIHRGGRDAPSGLDDFLLQVCSLGVGEGFLLAPEAQVAASHHDTGCGTQPLIGL